MKILANSTFVYAHLAIVDHGWYTFPSPINKLIVIKLIAYAASTIIVAISYWDPSKIDSDFSMNIKPQVNIVTMQKDDIESTTFNI